MEQQRETRLKVLRNILWGLSGLFLILVLFDSSLSVPKWLAPFGRMHPMILHFPIVLVVLITLASFWDIKSAWMSPFKEFLIISAVITVITAIMGVFLSAEAESSSLLFNHKWSAVALVITFLTLTFITPSSGVFRIAASVCLVLVILTGHFGANITHGKNFVLAPIMPAKNQDGSILQSQIMPILESKCTGCHNPEKKKGKLDMSNFRGLMTGGENGAVVNLSFPDSSTLLKRIHLPIMDEEHMPPEGKSQMQDAEIKILTKWIEHGASPSVTMSQLSEEDDLAMAINAHIESNQAAEAAFGFASPSLLAKLNNSFRTVTQPAPNLPGVEVSYFVQAVFDPESLTELLKIKEQIVQLDLSYMPVKDEHLEIIGNFANLQHLSLNFTEIDGSGLIYLVGNEKLSKLSLAGTLVSEEALRPLEQPMHVYLWNTKVTSIPPGNVNMTGYFGYNVDQEDPIALTPPEVANKRSVVKKDERIVLKHNVPGVQISYRLDTEKPQISDEYTGPIPFEDFVTVTAVAYKEGWLESPEIKRTIYKESLPIDSITIIQDPNPKFTGLGAPSLVDSETGDISDFSSGNWLGYREKPLEIWLKTSVPVRKVILSYGVNINSYIMPPWRVEVWSSSDGRQFTRLDSKVPAQPVEYEKSHTANESFELTGSGPFYKVIAYPVPELPAWHNGKGEKGWVFVDELYLY